MLAFRLASPLIESKIPKTPVHTGRTTYKTFHEVLTTLVYELLITTNKTSLGVRSALSSPSLRWCICYWTAVRARPRFRQVPTEKAVPAAVFGGLASGGGEGEAKEAVEPKGALARFKKK